jgi:Predicted Zn-dependent protease
MNITLIRSDEIYRKMMNAPKEKRDDIYRYELMKPFEFKWACINVPIKPVQKGGYDVVMASSMLGFLPPQDVDETMQEKIDLISDSSIWLTCEKTMRNSLERFTNMGYELPVKDYIFSIILGNPKSPYISMSDGYTGDGGIPGYIFIGLDPSKYTISRISAVLAHECNHNVRFQFQKWKMDITLAEMMICEGLAENFATLIYGEDMVGPWVSKTDMDTLNNYIKPIIKGGLDVTGLANITSYLYGDEFARLQGYFPVGLPYCAGYACGYYMIKHYLKKTGKSIEEATLLPASEIMKDMEDFWDEQQ